MKTCQRRQPAAIKDTAYILSSCNRMELFAENTQRIPETRSYKTLQSKTARHKGKLFLFPKSGYRFNLGSELATATPTSYRRLKAQCDWNDRLSVARVFANPSCSSTLSEESGASSYHSHHPSTSPQNKSHIGGEDVLSSRVRNL